MLGLYLMYWRFILLADSSNSLTLRAKAAWASREATTSVLY